MYEDWGIGFEGTQPLVISEDRRRFRELTTGGVVICGRKTFSGFPNAAPLTGRRNIVMSRAPGLRIGGAEIADGLPSLFALLKGETRPVFVIGGGQIYRLLLPYCVGAHITKIAARPVSDVFFPNLDERGWLCERRGGGAEHEFLYYKNTAALDFYERAPELY